MCTTVEFAILLQRLQLADAASGTLSKGWRHAASAVASDLNRPKVLPVSLELGISDGLRDASNEYAWDFGRRCAASRCACGSGVATPSRKCELGITTTAIYNMLSTSHALCIPCAVEGHKAKPPRFATVSISHNNRILHGHKMLCKSHLHMKCSMQCLLQAVQQ